MAAEENRNQQNENTEQPSGYSGDNPADKGKTTLRSTPPENKYGQINPSSPTQSTEGPSTNLGNPTIAGGEGMGSMGYGGSEKPRAMAEQGDESAHSAQTSSNTGTSPTETRPGKEGGGNLREEKEVA